MIRFVLQTILGCFVKIWLAAGRKRTVGELCRRSGLRVGVSASGVRVFSLAFMSFAATIWGGWCSCFSASSSWSGSPFSEAPGGSQWWGSIQSLPMSLKVGPQCCSFRHHFFFRSPQGRGVLFLFVMLLELWRRKKNKLINGSLGSSWTSVLGRLNRIYKSEAWGCVS